MANQDRISLSHAVERDLRLDLFRGVGLWMIFLDHVPDDFVSWLTLRNYGFSDAAEVFVFISGYLAGYIYGPIIGEGPISRRPQAAVDTRLADVRCPHHVVPAVYGADRAHGQEIRQPDV